MLSSESRIVSGKFPDLSKHLNMTVLVLHDLFAVQGVSDRCLPYPDAGETSPGL